MKKIYSTASDAKVNFLVDDVLMEVYNEAQAKTHNLTLSHFWPVRRPCTITEKLPGSQAHTTGLRVIDGMFPSVLGGTCAVPGAFGCGKTVISQSLSKFLTPMQLFTSDAESVEMRWLKCCVIFQSLQ